MTRLELALSQVVAARTYTNAILDTIPTSDWFRQPAEGVTHVAWQVGHLAMAEFRLALERMRGVHPHDAELISPEFIKPFARDSVPSGDPAHYPPVDEIRAVYDRVHQAVLREIPGIADSDLDLPSFMPHKLFDTRLGALLWCSRHEMLHAGQVGLLRRLRGAKPIW